MSLNNFSIEMEVRDNELDAQGIVNNSNYMIYLSHARHKHGEILNINHTEFAKRGLNLIVTSCTMKFKNSLSANDKFIVTSKICAGDLPYHWSHKQDIKRLSDGKIILKAVFNATCVNNNVDSDDKLCIPNEIEVFLT
ncbi:MAG: acyl-CoA thioesterase [Legionella sp.]|uniref:acyl-CoA thioesterase n=1 Tax=Legionella sp. TaxID=459 RepID=UPI0039E2EBF2